eukprot:9636310-Alexandrium_andersonii.AAC.1
MPPVPSAAGQTHAFCNMRVWAGLSAEGACGATSSFSTSNAKEDKGSYVPRPRVGQNTPGHSEVERGPEGCEEVAALVPLAPLRHADSLPHGLGRLRAGEAQVAAEMLPPTVDHLGALLHPEGG